jgi:hypothetical protein
MELKPIFKTEWPHLAGGGTDQTELQWYGKATATWQKQKQI